MEMMKKTLPLAAAAMLALGLPARAQKVDLDPEGTVSYALPMTSLMFEVGAVQEQFHAGPYARFAQKYLGIDARLSDEVTYTLSGVTVTPYVEADQSFRYTLQCSSKTNAASTYLMLTSQGLVSNAGGSLGGETAWRFPAQTPGDFSGKGVSANYTSESATLTGAGMTAVQQSVLVEKPLEKKAQEAAEMILSLRDTRVKIVTGATDADYSGAAMEAALKEISRLEDEYLTLFTGYSEYQTQSRSFDVVPVNDGTNMAVAFRLSDTDGLLSADNMSGRPYFVEITPHDIVSTAEGKVKPGSGIMYRIPAICDIRLTDGAETLLQTRVPVFQFGVTKSYPIK